MRNTILLLLMTAFSHSYAQFYEQKVITEKDGLLNDYTLALYQDSHSKVIFAAHPMGISRIYGKQIETVNINEYNSDDNVYEFEKIGTHIFYHHFKILSDEYKKEEFPNLNSAIQLVTTDQEQDSIHYKEDAFRDSYGSFWMNLQMPDGSYEVYKITKNDTQLIELPFQHKYEFQAYFETSYDVDKRAKVFAEDNKKNIWILSQENQLVHFRNQSTSPKITKMIVPNFSEILQVKNDLTLVSSYATTESPNGIYVFKKEDLVKFIETEYLTSMALGPNGLIYFSDEENLYQLNGSSLKLICTADYFSGIEFDSLGNTYIWTEGNDYISRILKWNGSAAGSPFDTIFKTPDIITDMLVTAEGMIWIATDKNLTQIKPSYLNYTDYPFFDSDNPLPYYYTGNNKHGLNFYNSSSFIAYGEHKRIDFEEKLWEAFITEEGHFYGQFMNSDYDGKNLVESFYSIDLDANVKKLPKTGLDDYDYRLSNDYYGLLYKEKFYLNSNQGVYKFNGQAFTKAAVPLKAEEHSIIEVGVGVAHFEVFNLVSGYLDKKTKKIEKSIIYNFNSDQYIEEDWGLDSVYFQRYYGGKNSNFLAKVFKEDKILNHYDGKSSLIDIPISKINDSLVKSIYDNNFWLNDPIVDGENAYYFPASIHGLLIFYPKENRFVQLSKKDGLLSNEHQHLFFNTDSSEIYLQSYNGLQALALEDLADGKISKSKKWLRSEGIKGVNNHQWKNDSILLLHTEKGYITLQLSKKQVRKPHLVLKDIKVFNEHFNWEEVGANMTSDGIYSYPSNFELTYSNNYLSFEFQGVDHYSNGELKYSYQLIGVDEEPIHNSFGLASYQNIPSGNYTFEVTAFNNSGTASRTIKIPFRILKPFYEKTWFIILCILVAGLLFYGFYRWRVRELKRKELILKKLVKEKTLQLEDEKNVAIEQRDIIEEKNREITDSISYSKRLQDSILPPLEEIEAALPKSFVSFMPKDIVSGDFYWFEEVDDIKFIACADCTGHGVPGAMVSLVCANALNRCVNEFKIYDPAKILDTARKLIIRTFQKSGTSVKDGMDISLCAIQGTKMTYAGAYNPALIIRDKDKQIPDIDRLKILEGENELQIFELKADKQPVGLMDEMYDFQQTEIELLEGDTLYLYSDGFVDQFGGGIGKKFKAPNFRKLILSIQKLGMNDQKEKIEETFHSWKGELEQIDDVCVIGVRI